MMFRFALGDRTACLLRLSYCCHNRLHRPHSAMLSPHLQHIELLSRWETNPNGVHSSYLCSWSPELKEPAILQLIYNYIAWCLTTMLWLGKRDVGRRCEDHWRLK